MKNWVMMDTGPGKVAQAGSLPSPTLVLGDTITHYSPKKLTFRVRWVRESSLLHYCPGCLIRYMVPLLGEASARYLALFRSKGSLLTDVRMHLGT